MRSRMKIQEKKRKRARRRKRLKIIAIGIKSILFFMVLALGVLLAIEWNDIDITNSEKEITEVVSMEEPKRQEISQFFKVKKNKVVNYEVGKPQLLERYEMNDRLKNLSDQYPEFTEIYENMDAYPEELIFSLCNNPEMIDFVKGYLTADGSVTGGLTQEELSSSFPLLLQWDERWGYASYGESNIALAGCATTCLSIVAVGLTGNEHSTPDAVADYSMSNGFYMAGTGTMWNLMTEGCRNFGVRGEELGLGKGSIFSNLNEGRPIICSMRRGDFTTLGHFIVLTGIEDEKIRVIDPNCIDRSNKLWEYEDLELQIKNLWVFTQG